MKDGNTNLRQSMIIVNQLAHLGVNVACIASGSRSTPLTLALTMHPSITCYAFVDERGAAFFALGRAKISNNPVIVVSTSGTAGANFYPAVIEAKEIGVPLLIFTADRPHELRISGANQTMDQLKLYGSHVNWFSDVALPEVHEKATSYAQHLALQAYQNTLFPKVGPVHLNFPFRKPLEPQGLSELEELRRQVGDLSPLELILPSWKLSNQKGDELKSLLERSKRLLLILGPDSSRYLEDDHLLKLATQKRIMIFADALSGFRYSRIGRFSTKCYDCVVESEEFEPPEVIVQFGEMPISKSLNEYLDTFQGNWIICTPSPKLTDATLSSTHVVKTDPQVLVNLLLELDGDPVWVMKGHQLGGEIHTKMVSFMVENNEFEPEIIRRVLDVIPTSHIWIANSLSVRHFDEFIHEIDNTNGPDGEVKISSSRGLSGIDGTISTALGASSQHSTLLVTGDLAFYHDLNALLTLKEYDLPLLILLVNNQGGSIFSRLPISKFDPPFEEFFRHHHDLTFDLIAKQFGVNYIQISNLEMLEDKVTICRNWRSGIIEIVITEDRTEAIRRSFKTSII